MQLDTQFDYWADVNPGRSVLDCRGSVDPDGRSPRLQRAHQLLWSKPLPTGLRFDLALGRGAELRWGVLRLSSDSISNSYLGNGRMRPIVQQVLADAEEMFRWGSRIGAYLLFPAQRIAMKPTINGARGMSIKIGDRMDLTLEAIRRRYLRESSPLAETLDRYADFFALFGTFQGYVDFWLLNDLVDDDYQVRFLLPFDDFRRNAPPADVAEYMQLKTETVRFLKARTERIERVVNAQEPLGRREPA